jgi:hypothetical protein
MAWCGPYACRRGLATAVKTADAQLAAKSLWRHASFATTQAHYIEPVSDEAAHAMDKISTLFDNRDVSGRPS